jgi:hypothetical protein
MIVHQAASEAARQAIMITVLAVTFRVVMIMVVIMREDTSRIAASPGGDWPPFRALPKVFNPELCSSRALLCQCGYGSEKRDPGCADLTTWTWRLTMTSRSGHHGGHTS